MFAMIGLLQGELGFTARTGSLFGSRRMPRPASIARGWNGSQVGCQRSHDSSRRAFMFFRSPAFREATLKSLCSGRGAETAFEKAFAGFREVGITLNAELAR